MKTIDFFTEWLEDEKLVLQKSTYEAYTVYFNKHIVPYFSKHCEMLSDITSRDVKNYINYIKSDGRLDGKKGGLSDVSIKKHLSVLKQSLNDAVVYGYIPFNPAMSIKFRKITKSTYKTAIMMTVTEAQNVINAFKMHRLYPIVVLALYYGLRRSEVLGLRWSAIDFENNELRIEHTIVKNLTIEAKDSTKTDNSNATYELLPEIREMLLKMKNENFTNSDYVFVWEDGRCYRPDYVTRAFQKQLKKSHLAKMRFHDLRHSTASILFDKGMSLEDVKNWLRHSDIETTSNIYLHYGRARQKIVSSAVAGLFEI